MYVQTLFFYVCDIEEYFLIINRSLNFDKEKR